MIRKANDSDVDEIAKLWRAAPELGRPVIGGLRDKIARGWVHVAIVDDTLVGFVEMYNRQDNVTTVNAITVSSDYRGRGIGRALLWSVPAPFRLLVGSDNERAVRFYRALGMIETAHTTARTGKPMTEYRLNVLFVTCAGNNPKVPAWCRFSGVAYGSRYDHTVHDWPYMIDVNWRDLDWPRYMAAIANWRPVMAVAPDYERPDQLPRLREQIAEMRALGVLRVAVVPKFSGAVADIPTDCIIGLSLPTSYAGFIPPLHELSGRQVHLLGGSPRAQYAMLPRLRGVGTRVVSADGNSHIARGQRVFVDGQWSRVKLGGASWETCIMESGRNINRHLQTAIAAQPLLI
jgi:GNAT superfamily N-acetyltransferase